MKTLKNSPKNFNANLTCIAMILLSLMSIKSTNAQGPDNNYDYVALMNLLNGEGAVYDYMSIDAPVLELPRKQNKKTFGHNFHMLVTILREPFMSKRAREDSPYDVIIVPGIPFDEEKGAGMIMKARIKWAHYLISNGVAKNVIFSGSDVYTAYTESQIMALYAMKMGISAEHIFCETKAEHSTENVVYSLRLAEKLGFEKIAIATGPFQSAFLDKYVKDHSLPVSFIAIPLFHKGKVGQDVFSSIDPSIALVDDFVSLKDRESKAERYQGTLGNKIED